MKGTTVKKAKHKRRCDVTGESTRTQDSMRTTSTALRAAKLAALECTDQAAGLRGDGHLRMVT